MPKYRSTKYYNPFTDVKESSYKNIKYTFASESDEFQKWFKKNYPKKDYDKLYSEEKVRLRNLFDTVQRQAKNVLLRAKKFAPIIKDLDEFNKLGFYPLDYFSKVKTGLTPTRLYQLFGDRLQNIDGIDSKYFNAAKKYAAAVKSKKQEYGFKTKLLEESGVTKTKINLQTFRAALNRIGIHEKEIVPEGTGYGNRVARDLKLTNRAIEAALAGAKKYAAGIEVPGKAGSYIALMHLADRSAKTKVGELAYGSEVLNSLLANKNSGAEKFRTTLSSHMNNIVKNYKGKKFYNINKRANSIDQLRFKDALELKFGKSTGQVPLGQYINKILNEEARLMGMATDGLITMRPLDPTTFKRMEPAFSTRGMGYGTDIAETKILDIAKQSKEAGHRSSGPLSKELNQAANLAFKEIKDTLTPKRIQPIIDKIAAAMKGGLQNKTYAEIMALAGQCRTLKTSGVFKYGGRVKLQAGGNPCANVVEAVRKLPDEEFISLSKNTAIGDRVKNVFKGFSGTVGKLGARAAPLAGLAVAGAAIEPLIKKFFIDEPDTYLTNENQMKGMLLSIIEGETPKVDEEILKWQNPALGAATAAGAIPGAKTAFQERRGVGARGPLPEGVGKTRAALGLRGVLGKALGATFSPLAVAATTPLQIAAQRKGGTEWGDIATDPSHWFGPAFASTGAEMATRGIKNPMLLKALRMGMSPRTLSLVARRFGLPGLAISAGMWGYDKWKNRSINDED